MIANLSGAAMQQIPDWLGELGLSQYAERFVRRTLAACA